MRDLKAISTEELMKEISCREGVRSIDVAGEEFSKIQISGTEGKGLRYIKSYGPSMIIEIIKKG